MKRYAPGVIVGIIGLFTAMLTAQTPPLVVTATASCPIVATVDATTRPDARTGWGVQFTLNGAAAGRITTEPYTRRWSRAPNTYIVGARWTRLDTPSVTLPSWTVDCYAPTLTPPLPEVCGDGIDNDGDGQVDEGCATPPTEVCGDGIDNDGDGQIDEGCVVAGVIFGTVDPSILGECTAAQHDEWVVNGNDGYFYRTWHPQFDPVGLCYYRHEHGDDPALMNNLEIASEPVMFGYVGRRHQTAAEPNGHDEAHEGFKVFISNPGEVNDENRINRAWSRSVFHMGTGGPKRFVTQLHSAQIRVIHPEFGLKAFTQLMMDTGGTARVCDPRHDAPVKDVMALDFVEFCGGDLVGSGYEIWSTVGYVRNQAGETVYQSLATPAVFDPITVFNPANPLEVVYVWDPRMTAIREFNDDWTGNRGCDRESYAQPGYWYNANGQTVYYTDSEGLPLAQSNPLALRQDISLSNSIGAPTTNDGLGAFKKRVNYCQAASRLGLKN